MQSLRECSSEERPALGKAINDLKVAISSQLDQCLKALAQAEQNSRLATEKIDVTLPGRQRTKSSQASYHPDGRRSS